MDTSKIEVKVEINIQKSKHHLITIIYSNKNFKMYRLILLIAVSFICSCKSNKKASLEHDQESQSGVPALVTFLNSAQASEAIVKDDIDSLFSKINIAEIQIQMKENFEGMSEQDMRTKYIDFMKLQVSDWTDEDRISMYEIFQDVKEMCDAVSPRIFPSNIRLIKGKTKAYGNDAYFTREKVVFIPENIFPIKDKKRVTEVMLHEVFHIISRYNEELRVDLYKLINFTKMDKPVIVNDLLKVMRLCNPDGMSVQYATEIHDEKGSVWVVPFVTSKHGKFRPEKPGYFDYMDFELFKIVDYGTHYMMLCDVKGRTITPLEELPGYFDNIKDNTQYIIHPDEILADNFLLALLAVKSGDFSRFSPEGRQLIEQMLARLQQL